MAIKQARNEELRAVIDMGSNGIRFSITDLSSPTTRVLPTVFQDRCAISLFDAQYQDGVKIPIPNQVIEEVLGTLRNFKRVCEDFGVQHPNIQLVATEATRDAINSVEYLRRIEDETGWRPRLLSKEDEGLVISDHTQACCASLSLITALLPAVLLVDQLQPLYPRGYQWEQVEIDFSDLIL